MCKRWWIVGLLLGLGPSCGGSSSETPPPLEPSPSKLAAAPASADSADDRAGEARTRVKRQPIAPETDSKPAEEPPADEGGPSF